jgi:hypothetical protein
MRVMISSALFALAVSGCAMVSTSDVKDLNKAPNGVRVYAPKVYLLVDNATGGVPVKQTTIFILPDYKRAYDVNPTTIFAKQTFKVELEEGQLKTLETDQDTTAFLTFVKEAAQLAAKAAGVPVSQSVIAGTGGLPDGVYVLDDDGTLRRYKDGSQGVLTPMR